LKRWLQDHFGREILAAQTGIEKQLFKRVEQTNVGRDGGDVDHTIHR